jgi:hypothetical protein
MFMWQCYGKCSVLYIIFRKGFRFEYEYEFDYVFFAQVTRMFVSIYFFARNQYFLRECESFMTYMTTLLNPPYSCMRTVPEQTARSAVRGY